MAELLPTTNSAASLRDLIFKLLRKSVREHKGKVDAAFLSSIANVTRELRQLCKYLDSVDADPKGMSNLSDSELLKEINNELRAMGEGNAGISDSDTGDDAGADSEADADDVGESDE